MEGTIKTITDRDFGFIAPEDGSKDIVFHALSPDDKKALQELTVGTRVLFESAMTNSGPVVKAIKIGDKEILGAYYDYPTGKTFQETQKMETLVRQREIVERKKDR